MTGRYLRDHPKSSPMKNNLTTTALLAMALSLVLVGCATAPKDSGKRSNAIVERAFAAWNAHDLDKVVAAYSDDIVYEDVPFGPLNSGPVEFRAWAALCFSIIGDYKIEAVNTSIENGHGVVEWIWSGVDKDWFKTGKPFSVRGVSVIEVRDGKISRNKDYYDGAALLRQVGKLQD
jgi:steroid delta-isomerase-like uncharacterized protein